MEYEMKTTRFDRGAYRVSYRGRHFTLETDGYRFWNAGDPMPSYINGRDWVLIETDADGAGVDGDGYWNHFCTKRDALDAIREVCDRDAADGVTFN